MEINSAIKALYLFALSIIFSSQGIRQAPGAHTHQKTKKQKNNTNKTPSVNPQPSANPKPSPSKPASTMTTRASSSSNSHRSTFNDNTTYMTMGEMSSLGLLCLWIFQEFTNNNKKKRGNKH